MFDKATRIKLRINTSKGLISVEDLWDLPLTGRSLNLDDIAVSLSRQLKTQETESFVSPNKKADDSLQLSFDIVKHILDVKMKEAFETRERADKKAQKERIMNIIARKQDQQLENTSLDELQKMVADL